MLPDLVPSPLSKAPNGLRSALLPSETHTTSQPSLASSSSVPCKAPPSPATSAQKPSSPLLTTSTPSSRKESFLWTTAAPWPEHWRNSPTSKPTPTNSKNSSPTNTCANSPTKSSRPVLPSSSSHCPSSTSTCSWLPVLPTPSSKMAKACWRTHSWSKSPSSKCVTSTDTTVSPTNVRPCLTTGRRCCVC
eukprot:PhF_6_TR13452/c0_g2_i1/m.21540